MRQIIRFFVIPIVVFGCVPKTETQEKILQVTREMVEMRDSLRLPTFEIEVTLSDLAQKKMETDNETIIVKAYLSGEPKDSADVELGKLGELFLGTPEIELDKPGIARFDKIIISRKAYESLIDKDFEILINIFSGRRSSENNLLDAELLQRPVSDVIGKRHKLNAKLIEE